MRSCVKLGSLTSPREGKIWVAKSLAKTYIWFRIVRNIYDLANESNKQHRLAISRVLLTKLLWRMLLLLTVRLHIENSLVVRTWGQK